MIKLIARLEVSHTFGLSVPFGAVISIITISYLPNAFLSNMKGIVAENTTRQNRILFKLAVEMAMMMNILASMQDIDPITLQRLRGECVHEVKRLNGNFSFEDAVEWQK